MAARGPQGGRWLRFDAPFSYYRSTEYSLSQNLDQMLTEATIVIQRGISADALSITWLAAEGISFGSHLASHQVTDGHSDKRLRLMASKFGCCCGFNTEPGATQRTSDPLHLPHIKIRGDSTLAAFIILLEECR